METIENKLILNSDIDDDMIDDFLQLATDESVEEIIIKTDNVSSLVMQQLFCLQDSKKIVCEDPFLAKFFEDVRYKVA